MLGRADRPFWQRNYYERIVRNEDELNRIRQYIRDNPEKWAEDKNNPLMSVADHCRGVGLLRP